MRAITSRFWIMLCDNFRMLIVLGILTTMLTSCEKVIDIKLDEGTPQLAVDAFINNKPGTQVIKLTITSGYFHNAPCPPAIGATVKITDTKGAVYNFVDYTGTGLYEWVPAVGDTLVKLAHSYILSITYNSQQYQATSIAFPVPKIDSLNYQYRKGNNPSAKEAYYVSFYAHDFKGIPDFYWVKGFRNGQAAPPERITISQDGGFGPGVDGLTFIVPIRQSINLDDGFQLGDTCAVEVHSLNPEIYFSFQQLQIQIRNGGLFATPPANVSTNIKNINLNSSVKAVGFFNIAMVATNGIKIK